MTDKTVKPGTVAKKDMKLQVKDASDKTLGEINVKSGNRVPPTRISGAETYKKK
jgi:hypothetical protein